MTFVPRRLVIAAATVAVIAGSAVALPNVAAASTTPSTAAAATLPKPAIAGPGSAPLGGVVPGRTGSAVTASARAQSLHRESTLARIGAQSSGNATKEAVEHPAAGVYFSGLTSSTGIRANHSVFYGAGDRTVPTDVLYAPTVMPPSNACIEITTAYTSRNPVVWAWDWCASGGSGVAKEVTINAGFVATYTTPVNGSPAYSVEISKTNASNNTWTAYLYNFATGTWDTFWTRAGTSQIGADGWDVFEPYVTRNPATGVGYYCTSMAGQRFEASKIQVKVNGAWADASSSNRAVRYSLDLTCGSHLAWSQPNLANWSATLS
ncbi:hypothetical protein [Actinoplanes couchii]|uniref:Uncharacterized protein n=1 Tax=Actinoplanes couchii TaxID=403638 RepID=A0ABQ3XSX0_9ACTN|nr:hypothetical protein [Actinoplanes couchii]MDR6324073.1 hypothetical protein [Actinoplanes couchii]GID61600.1 hypothetical protein Aco03nite_100040 [Actinoplanes couchii]